MKITMLGVFGATGKYLSDDPTGNFSALEMGSIASLVKTKCVYPAAAVGAGSVGTGEISLASRFLNSPIAASSYAGFYSADY